MNGTALIKTLIDDGVIFSTDGESIRWENGEGKITPDVVDAMRAGKAEIIAFLSRDQRHNRDTAQVVMPSVPKHLNLPQEWIPDTKAKPDDPEIYAEALRIQGPMSYGMAMRALGWGGTRAGQAEDALRFAGRIVFNKQGRAVLSDNVNHQSEAAQ